MKEVTFINKNAKKWENFETILNEKSIDQTDKLADYYIQLTDDLAYAKTYYPNSNITIYLNQLTQKAHQLIYKNKKEKRSRIFTFWTTELPLINYESRKYFLYAFIVFIMSMGVGILSASGDKGFIRLVMGDAYVDMTIYNIENGDPMAVYAKQGQLEMFSSIAFNNIRVSFYAFIFGILFSFGTIYILFSNGVMLGAFNTFLFQYGVLGEASLSIWIHGTIEISVIIIAGGAGLILGNSILFPGTYKRKTSFARGTKQGVKIVIGLVPLFILAALLEGFVTRHSHMPLLLNLTIIFGSLTFILWYFILYPIQIHKKHLDGK